MTTEHTDTTLYCRWEDVEAGVLAAVESVLLDGPDHGVPTTPAEEEHAANLARRIWEATAIPLDGYTVAELNQLPIERLQAAIDKTYAAMNASAYVDGGVTEREAWQTAMRELGAVVTQHTAQGVPR